MKTFKIYIYHNFLRTIDTKTLNKILAKIQLAMKMVTCHI